MEWDIYLSAVAQLGRPQLGNIVNVIGFEHLEQVRCLLELGKCTVICFLLP